MTEEFGPRVAFLAMSWAWALASRRDLHIFRDSENTKTVASKSGVHLFHSLFSSPQTPLNLLQSFLTMCRRHEEVLVTGLIVKEAVL